MGNKRKTIDWSEERFKEMLVYQRKFLWHDDTIKKLAVWMGLHQGMTAVDVGCGLGYLGYTFWPFFGESGHYIGVDRSLKLLKDDASKASADWASGGDASFVNGDAYNIPLADNSADCVMCQVVLMHLKKPEAALAEMVRVAKPGGLIMCNEPDNLSSMLVKRYNSIPELSTDELLLSFKIALICNKGRIKLGQGDTNIGVKVVHMMNELGLTNIDARINDGVWFIEPPYEGQLQQHRLKIAKRIMLDEKEYKFWEKRTKEEFLAGEGDPKDYDRYIAIGDRLRPIIKEQFDKGGFFSCGSNDLYIIKGTKPK